MKNIAIFLYEDFQILDAAGPTAAFEIAERIAPGSYRFQVLSIEGGAIRSSSGISIESMIADDAKPLDTLIVVGGEGSRRAMQHHESAEYLRACAAAKDTGQRRMWNLRAALHEVRPGLSGLQGSRQAA